MGRRLEIALALAVDLDLVGVHDVLRLRLAEKLGLIIIFTVHLKMANKDEWAWQR